jgi:hypothetical protein
MANAENKTKATDADVATFVSAIDNPTRRTDAQVMLQIYADITGMQPKMWGPTIIGYGSYHYKYESGREGDMARAAFSPRKANLVLYLTGGTSSAEAETKMEALLVKLGKHNRKGGCLYVNKLADVDVSVLAEIVALSLAQMDAKYPH